MDTQRIQKICDEYLEYRKSEEYFEDNDWRYYIFEIVLRSVFGDDIFDKLRDIDRQKAIKSKRKEIKRLQAEINE